MGGGRDEENFEEGRERGADILMKERGVFCFDFCPNTYPLYMSSISHTPPYVSIVFHVPKCNTNFILTHISLQTNASHFPTLFPEKSFKNTGIYNGGKLEVIRKYGVWDFIEKNFNLYFYLSLSWYFWI